MIFSVEWRWLVDEHGGVSRKGGKKTSSLKNLLQRSAITKRFSSSLPEMFLQLRTKWLQKGEFPQPFYSNPLVARFSGCFWFLSNKLSIQVITEWRKMWFWTWLILSLMRGDKWIHFNRKASKELSLFKVFNRIWGRWQVVDHNYSNNRTMVQ